MRLDRQAIDALARRRRAALINSLSGFKTPVLVGTADTRGCTNLAILSSLTHIGADPPLLGLVFRPDTVERHTLENLRACGAYTINHVQGPIIAAAHQTSARYPRGTSEFAATGLTEHWEDGFEAPFVEEARVRIGLRLREELRIESNGTHLVIGAIEHIEGPDSALLDSGALDPAIAGSVAVAGLESYYAAELIERRAYAKPGTDSEDAQHISSSAS